MGYFTGRSYDSAQHIMFAQNEQMMERMEKLMTKVEEKLESLDGRENGEEKQREGGVSSGGEDDEESISSADLKTKGKALQAYQEMVSANREDWTYSARDSMDVDPNLSDDEETNLLHLLVGIKKCTIKMRRGEYQDDYESDRYFEMYDRGTSTRYDFQGVRLTPWNLAEVDETIPYHVALKPHWEEFADALDDFDLILDVMPDDAEPCFQISTIELPVNVFMMIMKSLTGKSFRHYKFINNDFGRYGVLAVIDLMDSNQYLQSLTLSDNFIDEEDEGDFCEAIARHPELSTINLDGCCEGRVFMLCELVRSNLLVDISMGYNDLSFISSDDRQDFINALVSNTSLEKLDLTENDLSDEDAVCLATALIPNSTLKCLCLEGNHRFAIGAEATFGVALTTNNALQQLFLPSGTAYGVSNAQALFDDSSLNSAADSNHTCFVKCYPNNRNEQGDPTGNRQRKIYNILARRHIDMCNVQHFDDIDINLLPEILAAVQRYASTPDPGLFYTENSQVNGLSIIFEIMRKWDKAQQR
eukprot:scaffold14617_cov113-Skeletonema_dohrnii-CCMP3373.AAC.2